MLAFFKGYHIITDICSMYREDILQEREQVQLRNEEEEEIVDICHRNA